jgi:hypothetical protein
VTNQDFTEDGPAFSSKLCRKLWACHVMCIWALSWMRTTLLLWRPGHTAHTVTPHTSKHDQFVKWIFWNPNELWTCGMLLTEKATVLREKEKPVSLLFVHYTSHLDRMGSNPRIHSKKPGTNHWTLAWHHKIRILD